MKGAATFGGIAVLIVILVVAMASVFTVDQTEQALVLRFGEPVAGRGLITTPGLHFKYPFIENVVYLDNRILVVEAPKQEVLASDSNRLDVDSFLRYRIVDPLEILSDGRLARTGEQSAGLHPELGGAPGAQRGDPDRNRARQSRRSHGQDPRAGEPGRAAASASTPST